MNNEEMRLASGGVRSEDPLVKFFYLLIRDYMPAGDIESLMNSVENYKSDIPTVFTNGWLAEYAMNLAKRLRKDSEREHVMMAWIEPDQVPQFKKDWNAQWTGPEKKKEWDEPDKIKA
jgi:hypothetical protein